MKACCLHKDVDHVAIGEAGGTNYKARDARQAKLLAKRPAAPFER